LLTHDTSIDGSTQTAFSGNTNTSGPEVELIGGAGRPPVSFSGISMSGDNNAVKFLVVNGFGAALSASYGVDNTPSGNQLIDGGPGSTSPVPVCATPLSRTTPSASTSATGSSMSPTTAFAALVTRTTASPATPSTTTAAWRDSLGIAAQLDANSAATPYDLFLDQVSFTR